MLRVLILLVGGWLMTGCAGLAPVSSLIGPLQGGSPVLQVHNQTSVILARGNFVLVKTNVVGRSKGFSLLGFITIAPASLTQAMNRMYASAQMCPGEPQTVAHLIVERSRSHWILFGIPKIEVRADIVEFRPQGTARERAKTQAGTPQAAGPRPIPVTFAPLLGLSWVSRNSVRYVSA